MGVKYEEIRMGNNFVDRMSSYFNSRALWMCGPISLPDSPRTRSRGPAANLNFLSILGNSTASWNDAQSERIICL